MKKIFLKLFIFTSCQAPYYKRGPANIFYEDDRESFEPQEFPQWGHIHKQNKITNLWGTGFLIHSCYVATAYHVVRPSLERMTGKETVYFFRSLESAPIKANPVLWGKAWQANKKQLNAEDWSVLKLEKCLDVEPLILKELPHEQMKALPLVSAGYPEDKRLSSITVDNHCVSGPEVSTRDTGFGHDCATRPGNSGSPVMTLQGQDIVVIGMTVSTRGYFPEIIDGYSDWISNRACPIGPLKNAFEEYLKEQSRSR